MTLDDCSPAELAVSEANLVGQKTHLPASLPGASVSRAPDLTVVDSGVPSDMFNVICGARLAPAEADDRIAAAIGRFRTVGAPFSWWVGPTSGPPDLGARLSAHGLVEAETHVGMVADLADLPITAAVPDGLVIRRVAGPEGLMAFAEVVAALFDPPDPWVIPFYERASRLPVAGGSPTRHYVGYLDGVPVATSEGYVADGVVGVYAVVTADAVRRRGIGTAMTHAPLLEGRGESCTTGVLQASAEGLGVYARLGFRPCGVFREFKPSSPPPVDEQGVAGVGRP